MSTSRWQAQEFVQTRNRPTIFQPSSGQAISECVDAKSSASVRSENLNNPKYFSHFFILASDRKARLGNVAWLAALKILRATLTQSPPFLNQMTVPHVSVVPLIPYSKLTQSRDRPVVITLEPTPSDPTQVIAIRSFYQKITIHCPNWPPSKIYIPSKGKHSMITRQQRRVWEIHRLC